MFRKQHYTCPIKRCPHGKKEISTKTHAEHRYKQARSSVPGPSSGIPPLDLSAPMRYGPKAAGIIRSIDEAG